MIILQEAIQSFFIFLSFLNRSPQASRSLACGFSLFPECGGEKGRMLRLRTLHEKYFVITLDRRHRVWYYN